MMINLKQIAVNLFRSIRWI